MNDQNHSDPNQYVRENKETLVEVIKHGDDGFIRALAMAALVEYGGEPEVEQVRRELDRIVEQEGPA